jgi:hypothetical protein
MLVRLENIFGSYLSYNRTTLSVDFASAASDSTLWQMRFDGQTRLALQPYKMPGAWLSAADLEASGVLPLSSGPSAAVVASETPIFHKFATIDPRDDTRARLMLDATQTFYSVMIADTLPDFADPDKVFLRITSGDPVAVIFRDGSVLTDCPPSSSGCMARPSIPHGPVARQISEEARAGTETLPAEACWRIYTELSSGRTIRLSPCSDANADLAVPFSPSLLPGSIMISPTFPVWTLAGNQDAWRVSDSIIENPAELDESGTVAVLLRPTSIPAGSYISLCDDVACGWSTANPAETKAVAVRNFGEGARQRVILARLDPGDDGGMHLSKDAAESLPAKLAGIQQG